METRDELDPHRVRVLAVASHTDPRSVLSLLRGGRVRPTIRARIVAALEQHGLLHLLPVNDGSVVTDDAPATAGGAGGDGQRLSGDVGAAAGARS